MSADDTMAAIDATAAHLPDLQVFVAQDCRGEAWLVDPRTCTVWVDGSSRPDVWSEALLDALDELCRIHSCPAPRGLRLVHSVQRPRDTGQPERTGTV